MFLLLAVRFSAGATYTPNSETLCSLVDDDVRACSAKIYSAEVFTEEGGEFRTLPEISTIKWENGGYNFSYKQSWVLLEPFIIAYNKLYTATDIRTIYPSLNLKDFVYISRFDHKFGWGITNIPLHIQNNIQYLGFRLKSSDGLSWDDIRKDGQTLIIKDKITVDWFGGEQFTHNLVNRTYMLYGNITDNIINGSIYLDPTITLGSGNVTVDYYAVDTGGKAAANVPLMRWDISSIPTKGTITNATVCLYETQSGLVIIPDDDLNVSRIINQTWIFGNTDLLYPFVEDPLLMDWADQNGGNPTYNTFYCANITEHFKIDYAAENTYASFWFEDPDKKWNGITSTQADTTTLQYGSATTKNIFASSGNANVSARPYMTVIYEAEANPPTIEMIFPPNNTEYDPYVILNFTANVTDGTEIKSVKLYGDFRNGTFLYEQQNLTTDIVSANYSFYQNMSDWFDGGDYFGRSETNLTDTAQLSGGFNGSMWVFGNYQKGKAYITNTTGFEMSEFAIPAELVIDTGFNGSMAIFSAFSTDKLYRYHLNGTQEGSCSLQNLGGNGNYYGLDFHPDGTIWVVDDTSNSLYHADVECNNLTGAFPLDSGIYQARMAAINDVALIQENTGDDHIEVWNLTSKAKIMEIPLKTILDQPIDWTSVIAIDRSKEQKWDGLQRIYSAQSSSPISLTSVNRFLNGTANWTLYACDIYDSCAWASSNFSFTVPETPPDIEFPQINLSDPLNQTYATTGLNLNHSETDNTALSVCWYNEDDGTNTTITCNVNTTFTSSEGRHTLNLYANDTTNNVNTTNVNYTVDLTPPTIILNLPLNQSYNSSDQLLNYSVTDNMDLAQCWYSLDGGSNTTLANCKETTLAGLSEGAHNVTAWANDTANNLKQSAVVWFTIDTTAPTITIHDPLNQTYNLTHTTMNLSTTADEAISVWWYQLNSSGVNTSFAPNTTFIAGNGSNYLQVWANDTVGNEGYAERWFEINHTAPEITPTPSANNTKLFRQPWFWDELESECLYPWPISYLLCRN